MCLQFGFVIFWQKDFGAKAAHKMLVKLTPGHFQNGHFLYFVCPVHQGKEGLPDALVEHPVEFRRLLQPVEAVFGLFVDVFKLV